MAHNRQTHFEDYRICRGYDGSPKGRRKYRDCLNSWNIEVDITYHEEETTEESNN